MFHKFFVCTNSSTFLSHSNMTFINSNTLFSFLFYRILMFTFIFFWWVPEHTIENISTLLDLHWSPSWIPIHSYTISSFNMNFLSCTMSNSWSSIFKCPNSGSKTTKLILFTSVFLSIPIIKFTKYRKWFRTWCPFLIHYIIVILQTQPKLFIWSWYVFYTTFSTLKNI